MNEMMLDSLNQIYIKILSSLFDYYTSSIESNSIIDISSSISHLISIQQKIYQISLNYFVYYYYSYLYSYYYYYLY